MSRSSVPWRSSVDGILDILGKRMYHCSPRTSRRLEFGIRNLEFAMEFVRTLRGDHEGHKGHEGHNGKAITRLHVLCVVLVAAFAVLHADSSALTGRMNIARSGHQATLLMDGRVLVTGGSDQDGQAIGRAEMYDPINGTWSLAQGSIIPRLGPSAALLHDGRVLVA